MTSKAVGALCASGSCRIGCTSPTAAGWNHGWHQDEGKTMIEINPLQFSLAAKHTELLPPF
eukprot:scaffold91474_cov21-Tisochrysis_lutea.AAC.2